MNRNCIEHSNRLTRRTSNEKGVKDMAGMFDPNQVQPWIDTLEELFKIGDINYKHFFQMEQDIQKMRKFLVDYSNLKYALDVSAIVAVTDKRGRILYANDKFCELSKYSHEELIGKDHRILNSGYHDKQFFKKMWETIIKGEVWEGEVKNKAKDGSFYWVKTTIVPFKDHKGNPVMHIAIRTDISEGKFAQEQLVTALQNDFRHVVNSLNNLIIKVTKDEAGNFIYKLNEGKLAYELGLEEENMRNKSPYEIFPREIAKMLEAKYELAFLGTPASYDYSFHDRQLLTNLSPIYRDGKVIEVIGCINDITDLHKAQEEVEFMAFHDLLTSLPNRRKFRDDLNHMIVNSSKNNQKIAVFFLDLDRFKQINDSLGHTVGDELIKEVSILLRKVVGPRANIYRLAGDEYVIVFSDIVDEEMVEEHARKILSLFDKSILLSTNLQIYTTCSVGISIFPDHGETSEALLKNADAAMYAAKESG